MGAFKKGIILLKDPDELTEEAEKLFYNNRITTLPKEYQDNPYKRKEALNIINKHGFPCIYLYGNVGTGKTTVATQILRLLWDRGIPGKWIDYPAWDSKANASYKRDEMVTLLKEEPGVILLDDFIFDNPTPYTRENSHNIINYRSTNGLITIITSNITLMEIIQIYDPKLTSRLAGYCGEETVIKGSDHRNLRNKDNEKK